MELPESDLTTDDVINLYRLPAEELSSNYYIYAALLLFFSFDHGL
jgi:hypothetical protein